MITYFLQRKNAADDEQLTHQSSKVTAVSSEDYEVHEVDDQIINSEILTQKRKSLCRQHNIFSSLNNKSIASEQSIDESIDSYSMSVNEKSRLIDEPKYNSLTKLANTVISPEIFPKSIFKPNIPAHCTTLKDSIESLEKLLKHDYSLADINTTKIIIAANPVGAVNIENGDITANCTSDMKAKLLPDELTNQNGIVSKANGIIPSDTSKTTTNFSNNCDSSISPSATPSQQSAQSTITSKEDCLRKTLRKTINFRDRSLMKVSKSWYPLSKDQSNHKAKLPNSKSLHLITSPNSNNQIFL